MTIELTAEEILLLTPQERAAIEEPDAETDTSQGDQDANKGQETTEEEQAAAAAAAADPAAVADADAAAADVSAAAATDEADQAAAQARFQPGNVPLIRPGQTDDSEARTQELESRLDALAEQFDNGDITTKEFLSQQREINRDLSKLEMQAFRTELSNETTQASQQQVWDANVASFLNDNPELSSSNLRLQAYDFELRKVTGDEANEGKSDLELLKLARDNWASGLGIELKPAAEAAPAAAAAAKPAKSATDRPAQPSLANAPAAASASVDDGRFATLDRLMAADPIAFESELAKLSPAAQDEYLRYGGA